MESSYEPIARLKLKNLMNINKIRRILDFSKWKTLRLNFKHLKIREAIKLPIFVSKNVKLLSLKGCIKFECPIKSGLVKVGFETLGIADRKFNRTIWFNEGEIIFKKGAEFGNSMRICVFKDGNLYIGEASGFTGNSTILCSKKISLGDRCLISWECQIMDTDFHKIMNTKGEIINPPKNIRIGDHVWIGSRCSILKGSIIPSQSVLSSGSIVNKAFDEEGCIYGGIPAICLRKNIIWEK